MTVLGAARASISSVRPPIVALFALVCVLLVGTFADTMVRSCPPGVACGARRAASSERAVATTAAKGESRLLVSIRDAERAPVAGARATAFWLVGGSAFLAGAGTSDAAGQVTIAALPGGEYFVLAEAEGRARTSTRVVLGEADGREVALLLQPVRTLGVAVLDDRGAPLANAWVEVDSGDPLPYVGTTDAQGLSTVGRLGPPPYRVRVGAAGHEAASEWVTKVSAEPVRFALRPLGTIEAVVVDTDGAPVPSATVAIVGSGLWPARLTKVDATGHARIADLPAGAYNLRATAGDRVATSEFGLRLERGQTRSVTLAVVPGRRLTARVVQADADEGAGAGAGAGGKDSVGSAHARPVARANVVLTEGGLSPFPVEGTTDEQGRVVLGPVALSGDAYLSARAEGFVAKSGVPAPREAQGEIVIALGRGATLRGEVVDARGFPVPGATIEVVGTAADGTPIDETPERNAFRAAHFTWALAGPRQLVRAGELGVMAGPIPTLPRDRWGAVPAPGSEVSPGAIGRGGLGPRITDLVKAAAAPEPWVTRSDGTFRARPIPAGRVRVIVRHPAYVETSSGFVTLSPAGEGSVHVVMSGGGRLEGRVFDDHRHPVPGARIELAAMHGSLERSTSCAQDGTFAFASVPGEVSLSVFRPDALDEVALHALVTVQDAETRTLELVLPAERDSMTIDVTDDRGLPLSPVQVLVASLAPDAPVRRTLFTDRNGNAAFSDVAGLPVRLQATFRGRAPWVRELESAPREWTIVLGVGTTLTGTVTARGGRDVVSGADVTLHVATGALEVRTGRDGSFRLENVPSGRARMLVRSAGHVAFEKVVTVEDATRVDCPVELEAIVLQEGGALEGEVVDARGDPVVGARVSQGAALSYVPSANRASGAATDRTGAFRFVDLPEGPVSVEAYHPDKGRGRGVAEIRAGRTTDRVRITLESAAEPSAAGQAHADDTATGGVAVTLAEHGQGEVIVAAVAPRSEAERAGIMPGDRLIAIDGAAVDSVGAAHHRMFGPLGDDIVVELVRDGAPRRLRVARERVRH